jgi:hypothetical protein
MDSKSDLSICEGNVSKYRITLKTWFKRTYEEEETEEVDEKYGLVPEECKDPDCFCFSNIANEGGKKEFDIDTFMLRNFNYEDYAAAVMYGFIDEERELLTDFVYQDGGIISFTFTHVEEENEKLTPSKIKEEILMDSFEDGMYEGSPGNEGVVALNFKYKDKFEPSGYIHGELGVIDCRKKKCIKVVKL